MAWDHLSITKPHLVYIILGGFTSLFMLCSSVIKERMYIGEATVATICGIIFGPHAANLIDPGSWGNVDEVTLEFSRIVLVVQCFAVGVELPRYYMEKHWKSVIFLLLPVMTFGWLITSLFIWWLIPPLTWLQSLAIAACVTATDPVLASSVVGKGKFAKRVPRHLRDLLSAESGCNDGMAFPFIYLALYLLQEHNEAGPTVYHWMLYTVLYECVFGAIYGFLIGYIARRGIRFAEKHDLIDRESFLVFYFTLALFCAGSGSLLGVDDLLVGFAAGVGFSNDGWFSEKTEESHVSNVIDLLINLAYFVFLGTIIPWEQYNNMDLGLSVWRLVVIAILVIFFRRIPIMMALKPVIPDVKTWREALFAGHFGPIGVGAIFVAILCRAELEHEGPIPLSELPPPDVENYEVIAAVWPIVTFMVIVSIIVHGSSVAVFTLGKRINTLQLTMSYTQAVDDGPSWMNRLPRISSQSKSQARTMSDTDFDDKPPEFPPGTLPPTGYPGSFLRRQREEENPSRAGSRASSLVSRRHRAQGSSGAGGPVSQSAIFPQRRSEQFEEPMSPADDDDESPEKMRDVRGDSALEKSKAEKETEKTEKAALKEAEATEAAREENGETERSAPQVNVYDEGDHIVVEDADGSVLAVEEGTHEGHLPSPHEVKEAAKHELQKPHWTYDSLKKNIARWRDEELSKRRGKDKDQRKHEPARAYQFGNTIIVEDEDGEVLKKYDLPPQEGEGKDYVGTSLKYMGLGGLATKSAKTPQAGEASGTANEPRPGKLVSRPTWTGLGRKATGDPAVAAAAAENDAEDDRKIRFTIGGAGQRMTKDDFLREVQKLDVQTRRQVINQSTAPEKVKEQAKAQASAKPISGPSVAGPSTQAAGRSGAAKSSRSPAASSPPDSQESKSSGKAPMRAPAAEAADSETEMETRGRVPAASPPKEQPSGPEEAPPGPDDETAAEKRRRLAAFASVREDDEAQETPAERRRRAAALGLGDDAADSDSDDDNTPRMTASTRRGIRFADE